MIIDLKAYTIEGREIQNFFYRAYETKKSYCLFFKRFIVPSSMHIQHHYRKNIRNNFLFLNKTTNRKQSKQFITRKGSYILSYKFQREDSKNLTVFFYLDMTIGLI